jgi:hypothetical protein
MTFGLPVGGTRVLARHAGLFLLQTVDPPGIVVYCGVMARKPTDTSERTYRATIWITHDLHYQLRKAAFDEERNISEIARELIADGLKRRKRK